MIGLGLDGMTTTHGGIVHATTNLGNDEGRAFLRVGDWFWCPLCKCKSELLNNVYPQIVMDGRAVVPIRAKFSCGAELIGVNNHTVMEGGSSRSTAKNEPVFYFTDPNLNNSFVEEKKDEEKDKEKTILCKPECLGETITFDTTPGPYIISMELWKFILSFEGFESTPYVPKNSNSSGVTLGYGYDLGQQSAAQIRKDLSTYYTIEQINRLVSVAQGKKGAIASGVLPKISDITITKDKATKMIVSVKKRYANQVVDIYPEVLELHPHCQGALLDLIYNRGNGLKDIPKQLTRSHMREIRDAFKAGTPEKIPDILRNMSKLWVGKGLNGLVKRRQDEATWFEKGLKCDCYK